MEYKINLDDGEHFNGTILGDGKELATIYDRALFEIIKQLSDALLDIAEDDCGCCDCAKRAREALGMKGGDL